MKKIVLIVLVSMMFASNLYAKGVKGGALKGSTGSKPAAAQQQKKADVTNQAAPAPAPNAQAQNPSLLQSAMPALVGGAVGSYVGSKLADDGNTEKSVEENKEKKEDQILKP